MVGQKRQSFNFWHTFLNGLKKVKESVCCVVHYLLKLRRVVPSEYVFQEKDKREWGERCEEPQGCFREDC